MHPRRKRERKTVENMIGIYCRDHHYIEEGLCFECHELAEYARLRLQNCPFQENKTTCGNCSIHCYKPKMKEKNQRFYAVFRASYDPASSPACYRAYD
jgi:hypothetical protein